jgi:hypothetical protein
VFTTPADLGREQVLRSFRLVEIRGRYLIQRQEEAVRDDIGGRTAPVGVCINELQTTTPPAGRF